MDSLTTSSPSLTTRGERGHGTDGRADVLTRVLEAVLVVEGVAFLLLVIGRILLALA